MLQLSVGTSSVRSDEADRPVWPFTQIGERLLFSSTKVSYGSISAGRKRPLDTPLVVERDAAGCVDRHNKRSF